MGRAPPGNGGAVTVPIEAMAAWLTACEYRGAWVLGDALPRGPAAVGGPAAQLAAAVPEV
ncbi:hypothetical protein HMSSN036_26600 [Paenibacillus macerans]|uniref:hypothetical protein n=1 Tax=Paenibacillus TaxID=44249 RepID=UPI000979E425|nr:hypothetical protein [Paenibacillus macerans]MBS5909820.1 hypothetical protein [Paenibacillus macerans]MEC0136494.1 hypothetical protein [Paenibacillus macerans]OMG50487.1 hypothetical protein BK140_06065 [Paenibacillus macerans]GIP11398.1 hypothetical protein J1TS5_35680 [Paenibacillus macerans]GJM70444.1 hypothetical protein HMSSN036_26600 [Paenibacillus macerans]